MGIVGTRYLLGVRTSPVKGFGLALWSTLLGVIVMGCSVLSGADAGEVEALELEVSNCFNQPGSEDSSGGGVTVLTVMVVECSEAHDFEIYHSFDLEDGSFPGEEAVEELWIAGCLAEFESFVGISFDASELDISAIYPTRDTWEDLGDREVLCSVTAVNGEPRSGSASGSRI